MVQSNYNYIHEKPRIMERNVMEEKLADASTISNLKDVIDNKDNTIRNNAKTIYILKCICLTMYAIISFYIVYVFFLQAIDNFTEQQLQLHNSGL